MSDIIYDWAQFRASKIEEHKQISEQHLQYQMDVATPSSKQVGGTHYTKYKIQPRRYGIDNNLSYDLTNALKYMTRHKDKHGKQDLLKAIHCIELEIEECYPNE